MSRVPAEKFLLIFFQSLVFDFSVSVIRDFFLTACACCGLLVSGFRTHFFIAVRERLILQISRKSGNHPVTHHLAWIVLFRENLINAIVAMAWKIPLQDYVFRENPDIFPFFRADLNR
jgi:hypothetical protein